MDTQLNAAGLRQASAVAQRLKSRHFDAAISSDLSRTVVTAEAIMAFHPHLTLQKTPALREWNFGVLQGKLLSDLRQQYPEIILAFGTENWNITPPGGETILEFQQRVSRFIDQLAEDNMGKRLLLVSHGGTIQRMFRHVTGAITPPNRGPACHNASIAVFRCSSAGQWQLVSWNDTAHLEELTHIDRFTL